MFTIYVKKHIIIYAVIYKENFSIEKNIPIVTICSCYITNLIYFLRWLVIVIEMTLSVQQKGRPYGSNYFHF